MRIVFIDMHCINFLTNTYRQMKDGLKLKTYKHRFIVDYALKNHIRIANFVTGNDTTVRRIGRVKRVADWIGGGFADHFILRMCVKESNYVTESCYGTDCNIEIINDVSEIKSDDILIAYLFNERQRSAILKFSCGHKVMMGNHFVALNEPYDFRRAKIEAFVNEIDLSDNLFVKKYLNCTDVKNVTCPYIYAERFRNLGRERKNKAMAIGTLSTCKGNSGYKLYREEFKTEWIQLMRKEIFEHGKEYPDEIDSYISYIFEDKKEIRPKDSSVCKVYKRLYNRYSGWTESKYTSFDMVEKFNEYTMFVCPEELVGMPGIGFVEGMACGTAYIGLDTSYYRKLGLVPGEHYITYDGTLAGLVEVIRYYQARSDETERIAEAGMRYVRDHFNAEVVAENFFAALEAMI